MVAGVARRPRNGIILSAALSLIATSRTALMLQKGPFPAAAAAGVGVAHRGQGWGGVGWYECRYMSVWCGRNAARLSSKSPGLQSRSVLRSCQPGTRDNSPAVMPCL